MNTDILPYQELVVFVDTSQNDKKKKALFVAIVEGEGISDILIPTKSFESGNPHHNELNGMLRALRHVRTNYDFDSILVVNDCEKNIEVINEGKRFRGGHNASTNEMLLLVRDVMKGFPVRYIHRSETNTDQIYACDRISGMVLNGKQPVHDTNKAFKQFPFVKQVFSEYRQVFI